jgi:hypothetical protein
VDARNVMVFIDRGIQGMNVISGAADAVVIGELIARLDAVAKLAPKV